MDRETSSPVDEEDSSTVTQCYPQANITTPKVLGEGRYQLEVGAGGQKTGSVMVHHKDESSVELTDLNVAPSHRKRGVGQTLVRSAAQMGSQMGKSKVTLASQNSGTGRLTAWYKNMGFAQVGSNNLGYPVLEAPIDRVLSGVAQRRKKINHATPQLPVSNRAISFFLTSFRKDSVRNVIQRAAYNCSVPGCTNSANGPGLVSAYHQGYLFNQTAVNAQHLGSNNRRKAQMAENEIRLGERPFVSKVMDTATPPPGMMLLSSTGHANPRGSLNYMVPTGSTIGGPRCPPMSWDRGSSLPMQVHTKACGEETSIRAIRSTLVDQMV